MTSSLQISLDRMRYIDQRETSKWKKNKRNMVPEKQKIVMMRNPVFLPKTLKAMVFCDRTDLKIIRVLLQRVTYYFVNNGKTAVISREVETAMQ